MLCSAFELLVLRMATSPVYDTYRTVSAAPRLLVNCTNSFAISLSMKLCGFLDAPPWRQNFLRGRLLRRHYQEAEIDNIFRRFPHSKRMFLLFGPNPSANEFNVPSPPIISVILPIAAQTLALKKSSTTLLRSILPPELGSLRVGFRLGPSLASLLVPGP